MAMNHNKYTFLRNKTNKTIGLFYGSIDDFTTEELEGYDLNPIPFEELDTNALKELLSNLLEDYNMHFRCQYEPNLITDCARRAGCNEKMTADFLRYYIVKLEKIYNR